MADAKVEKKIGQEFGNVRQQIDVDKLNAYLKGNVPAIVTPVDVKQFSYGQSNPTYILRDANSKRYVLRKKPPGDLLSPTAHAIEREFRVLAALGKHNASLPGTIRHQDAVPVPAVYCLCEDKSIVGTNFYVMEFVEGRIFSDPRMIQLPKHERRECWFSALRTLAALHRLDPKAIGLETYGKPKDFYTRQLRSLSMISSAQGQTKDKETGEEVGEIPKFGFLVDWFEHHLPKDENTIAHGDYKIDNIIFHPTEPRVIALLDWELSTRGHPLSDLANLLQPLSLDCSDVSIVNDPEGGEKARAKGEMFQFLGGLDPEISPIPSKEELMRTYCEAVGRPYPIQDWSFCEAWGWFRLAIITQGIAARVAQKQASSAQAKTYASKFPHCSEAVQRIIAASQSESASASASGKGIGGGPKANL